MDKVTVAVVPPLPMATGVPLKQLAARVRSGRWEHEASSVERCGRIGSTAQRRRPDEPPQPRFHGPTPF